jgi:hypothetical protein
MREDSCVMPQRPVHDTKASSLRAVLPAPNVAVAHPEQRLGRAGVPPAHFDEAQAEQALCQEFLLTVKIRQPSHEFTFGVGMTFVSYSLVLTPVV